VDDLRRTIVSDAESSASGISGAITNRVLSAHIKRCGDFLEFPTGNSICVSALSPSKETGPKSSLRTSALRGLLVADFLPIPSINRRQGVGYLHSSARKREKLHLHPMEQKKRSVVLIAHALAGTYDHSASIDAHFSVFQSSDDSSRVTLP
jgi:hypothetical protein